MRKFILWVFFPFIFIAALAIFFIPLMEHDPGYVLIAVAGKVIEMRFWMACLLFAVLILTLYITWALLKGTLQLTIKTFNWWPAKAQALLYARQERAMAALWEGNHREAHRNFIKILKTKGQQKNALTWINAANASADLGSFDEAHNYLNKADDLSSQPHAVTLLISRSRLLLKQGQRAEALALANQALSLNASHAGVLKLLIDMHQSQQDFKALNALLPRLKKSTVLPKEELDALALEVQRGLLAETQDVGTLQRLWDSLPKVHKKSEALAYFYVEQLLTFGCDDQAELWLRKYLKKTFNHRFVSLYGLVESSKPSEQLQIAEKWLSSHTDSAELYLALGRIAKSNALLDKAQSYFEKSIELASSADACLALANLLSEMGNHEASNRILHQSLVLQEGSRIKKTVATNSNLLSPPDNSDKVPMAQ